MIYYILSGLVGALVFCLLSRYQRDKRESEYREKYLAALDREADLEEQNCYLAKEAALLWKIVRSDSGDIPYIMTELAALPDCAKRLALIIKQKQEKDKCPE